MGYRERSASKKINSDTHLHLYHAQSPAIAQSLKDLHARYGKYAKPDAELRKILDKEMGRKTLTEELYAMREGK